jgi:hypothetical protein
MTSSEEISAEMKEKIAKSIENHILNYFDALLKKGAKNSMKEMANIPMDSVIPMAFIYYVVQASSDITFADPFVEFGSSMSHFKLLTDKQSKMLKPIKADFSKEQNVNGHMALFQVAVDDNFFNSLTSILTSIEKSVQIRDLLKGNDKAAPFMNMMTTSTIGNILP